MIYTDNSDGMLAVYDSIKDVNLAGLSALLPQAYSGVKTDIERSQIKGLFISRAIEIGDNAVKAVSDVYASLERDRKKTERTKKKNQSIARAKDSANVEFYLERDQNGVAANTVGNFYTIMTIDPFYSNHRYNLLKAAPEIHYVDDSTYTVTIKPWEDADEAESQRYIEEKYKIYSEQKHKKALLLLFKDREYNPVLDIIDNLPPWDGVERISKFLTKWMGCEDTQYTEEVSRLIFAGGINRLYLPGCKFDDVPVLIGTKQGEGKSSIIRWLAIHDDYYSEVTQFEGTAAIEQLEGAWVCEISEMLALNKTTEQEAVKAFITRQIDKYRKPYARNASNLPRRCVFIGTTNNERFLKDKTGNRRFYPVNVNMSGYDLYQMEKECREYILLCWAEARDKYKAGKMPNYANRDLLTEYQRAQQQAMEDDWRESAIINYLSQYTSGDRVCVRMIAREAFPLDGEYPRDPTKKESHEIGLIMDKLPEWQRFSGVKKINEKYGKQRGWQKISDDENGNNDDLDQTFVLPF